MALWLLGLKSLEWTNYTNKADNLEHISTSKDTKDQVHIVTCEPSFTFSFLSFHITQDNSLVHCFTAHAVVLWEPNEQYVVMCVILPLQTHASMAEHIPPLEFQRSRRFILEFSNGCLAAAGVSTATVWLGKGIWMVVVSEENWALPQGYILALREFTLKCGSVISFY